MKYGYSDGKRGLEAEFCLIDNCLYVDISGANHWLDYFDCIMAWPRVSVALGSRAIGKVHGKWLDMARNLGS